MKTVKDFSQYLIDFNAVNKGMQLIFRFPNKYGASIVCHSFSYGNNDNKFEIAIIRFYSDDDDQWSITYDTPITDDVLGNQTKEETINVLEKVMNL